MSDRIFIEPYRRRQVKYDEDAWVYRNLMRTSGVWYSIVQRGLVVGHTTEVAIDRPRFVVREGGRRRVLETGAKNVHAFVVGRIVPGYMPHLYAPPGHYAVRGRYNPRRAPTFEYEGGQDDWYPVWSAAGAHLGAAGLTIFGPECESTAHPRIQGTT